MELATIIMDRADARKAYLEYRRVVRAAQTSELDEVRARQLEQDRAIAAGYRALSVGRQLIRLSESILAGGFDDEGRPRLAVARCDTTEVGLRWIGRERIVYSDGSRVRSKNITVEAPGHRPVGHPLVFAVATVPPVPPQFRPDPHPRNYHILFEAAWRRPRTSPRGPGDPALLKHLRGDLWAVLAVWDLTPVERAALEGGIVL